MSELFFIICIGWAAYWLGGAVTEADLAQDCLRSNSFKADGAQFICLKEEQQ